MSELKTINTLNGLAIIKVNGKTYKAVLYDEFKQEAIKHIVFYRKRRGKTKNKKLIQRCVGAEIALKYLFTITEDEIYRDYEEETMLEKNKRICEEFAKGEMISPNEHIFEVSPDGSHLYEKTNKDRKFKIFKKRKLNFKGNKK